MAYIGSIREFEVPSLSDILDSYGAVPHNLIYRGKNLGTSFTSTQVSDISAGNFDDLRIGDYWTINGIVYRIIGFN